MAVPVFANDEAVIAAPVQEEVYSEEIQAALELIKETWQATADENPEIMPKAYVDIKNTRIVRLKENPSLPDNGEPIEFLQDIDYIIEFMMLTNYLGDSYPLYAGVDDTVAVYKDGSMAVQKMNLMRAVASRYFVTDYSNIIEEIIDLGSVYNGQLF